MYTLDFTKFPVASRASTHPITAEAHEKGEGYAHSYDQPRRRVHMICLRCARQNIHGDPGPFLHT
eukprot:6914822-Prorocentrum_lima.AAC.1